MGNGKEDMNSMKKRCAYGMADIYGGGVMVIVGTFFTVFLTKALGMPTALAGTIPLVGKIWDAVTDPVMGNICDRTRSKYGAKRLYLLIGSFMAAVTFLLMWAVFPGGSMGAAYAFYMVMYCLFSTGFTVVMVPYNALLPDMVDDYTVRAKFSGTRMIFSSFGAILAGLVPSLMITDNTDPGAYFRVGMIFAVIFFVAIFVTFKGTWEKQKTPVTVGFGESFVQSFTVFKSKSYRLFIGIFIFGQAAADFVTGLAVYYIDDVLNAYGGGRFTYLMGVILLSQFFGMIVLSNVIGRTSKKFPLMFGFPLRTVATLAMLFFSHEGANFMIILALTFVIGFAMAGTSLTIYAILADMADVDELITSINRPSICSAMATFIRKIAQGIATSAIGFLLAMVGYDEVIASQGGRQAAATQQGIAYIYIFVPIILMVISFICTMLYSVNQKEFDIIKKENARRRGEDTSVITKEEIAVCEKVTGFKYEKLWNRENALKL